MSRYIQDQNKLAILTESGTYAVATADAQWPGEVTEVSIDDAENLLEDRYLGNSSRNIGKLDNGPRDVTGTFSYKPVDMNLIAHAVGSVVEVSGTSFSHRVTEIATNVNQNPFTSGTGQDLDTPYSFTMEDSKQAPGTGRNSVRTINGAVINSVTLTAAQGEKVTTEVDWIGQTLTYSSGTTTSVTASAGKPYLWENCTLTVAGSAFDKSKDVSLEINNNIEPPHYLNGSRDIGNPIVGNRDYLLSVTADLDSSTASMLYTQFYKGGSELNWVFDLDRDTTGSQHTILTCSGARVSSIDMPSSNEGVNEITFEVMAGSLSLLDFTNPDNIGSYNPF